MVEQTRIMLITPDIAANIIEPSQTVADRARVTQHRNTPSLLTAETSVLVDMTASKGRDGDGSRTRRKQQQQQALPELEASEPISI